MPSVRTRKKLADLAAEGGVVRTICDVFEAESFDVPADAGDPPE